MTEPRRARQRSTQKSRSKSRTPRSSRAKKIDNRPWFFRKMSEANFIAPFVQELKKKPRVHITFCAAGIITSLMLYGVLQERIMTQPFGKEHWDSSIVLVLCNRLVSMTLAVMLAKMDGEAIKNAAPLTSYAAVSLSNVVATYCQYEALKYVSFPIQTLAKTAKMIPVMVWGTIIMRKAYTLFDYTIAILITLGCTLFVLMGEVSSARTHGASVAASLGLGQTTVGGLLMLGYLGFDGFTSTFQDKLFKNYEMSMYNQLIYVNLVSAIMSCFTALTSGHLVKAIGFVTRHPEALTSIITLSMSATVGQLFISHTIKTHGALLFATVMTTRQFLSILVSCLVFAHPLSMGQWLGTVIVFGTLYAKTFLGKSHKKKPASSAKGDGPA